MQAASLKFLVAATILIANARLDFMEAKMDLTGDRFALDVKSAAFMPKLLSPVLLAASQTR